MCSRGKEKKGLSLNEKWDGTVILSVMTISHYHSHGLQCFLIICIHQCIQCILYMCAMMVSAAFLPIYFVNWFWKQEQLWTTIGNFKRPCSIYVFSRLLLCLIVFFGVEYLVILSLWSTMQNIALNSSPLIPGNESVHCTLR